MLVPDTWEEQLFEVLPIIFLVFAYLHDAVLDNVGHNNFVFCSTFYPYSMRKMEMLHELRRKNALLIVFCCKMTIFGAKYRRKK